MKYFLSTVILILSVESVLSSNDKFSYEIELPCAQGMKKSSFKIDGDEFDKMDAYFDAVNHSPKAEVDFISEEEYRALSYSVQGNYVAMPEMQDSCVVYPNSGVEYIMMSGIIDCCGLMIHHKEIGGAGSHVTRTSKLSSLDKMLEPFVGKQDVNVTIVTSWKSRLLSQLTKHLTKKGFTPSIWSNGVIERQNPNGTQILRLMHPDTLNLSEKQKRQLDKVKSKKNKDIFLKTLIESKSVTPLYLAMNLKTGKVFWPGTDRQTAFELADSFSKLNRLPLCWYGMRYAKEVAPLIEKSLGQPENSVEVAFHSYPVQGWK